MFLCSVLHLLDLCISRATGLCASIAQPGTCPYLSLAVVSISTISCPISFPDKAYLGSRTRKTQSIHPVQHRQLKPAGFVTKHPLAPKSLLSGGAALDSTCGSSRWKQEKKYLLDQRVRRRYERTRYKRRRPIPGLDGSALPPCAVRLARSRSANPTWPCQLHPTQARLVEFTPCIHTLVSSARPQPTNARQARFTAEISRTATPHLLALARFLSRQAPSVRC